MKALHLILPGIPMTKKTSQRIIRFGRNREFVKVMPSEQFCAWFDDLMKFGGQIRREAERAGFVLPIAGPVEVTATVYRKTNTGDLLGYLQSVGDAIQARIERDEYDQKKQRDVRKLVRDGLGIIQDDKQIASWDGSRLLKDAANPRIELDVVQLQGSLLDTEPDADVDRIRAEALRVLGEAANG